MQGLREVYGTEIGSVTWFTIGLLINNVTNSLYCTSAA